MYVRNIANPNVPIRFLSECSRSGLDRGRGGDGGEEPWGRSWWRAMKGHWRSSSTTGRGICSSPAPRITTPPSGSPTMARGSALTEATTAPFGAATSPVRAFCLWFPFLLYSFRTLYFLLLFWLTWRFDHFIVFSCSSLFPIVVCLLFFKSNFVRKMGSWWSYIHLPRTLKICMF